MTSRTDKTNSFGNFVCVMKPLKGEISQLVSIFLCPFLPRTVGCKTLESDSFPVSLLKAFLPPLTVEHETWRTPRHMKETLKFPESGMGDGDRVYSSWARTCQWFGIPHCHPATTAIT